MKEKRHQKQLLQFIMLSLLSVFSVLLTHDESFAALQCNACHGQGVSDMRPLDTAPGLLSSYRNISTGAVKGNHSEHLPASATPADCARCHYDQAAAKSPTAYTSGHRQGLINFQANINSSPGGGKYKAGVAFVNQTSVPNLSAASCATTNCHFETVSPTWGTDPATVTCDTCHAAQPTTLSHAKHTAQYGGTASCAKCHGATKTTFQHATSANNAGRNIALPGVPTYAGSNWQWLPSQAATRTPGTCGTNYCHSSGQSATGTNPPTYPATVPTWGTAATGACSTCHATTTLASGSHTKHFTGVTPNTNCGSCHAGASAAAYSSSLHVDGFINVTGAYSQGKSHAPGNGYGTCSATACHDNGTGTKVVTPTWGTPAAGGTCTACHALQPATGSHTKHLSGTLYKKALCADCHNGTVQGVGINLANHLDGNIDVYKTVAGDLGYPVSKVKGSTYASCSTTYCHSSGQSATGTAAPVYGSATWGGTAACGTCHATTTLATGSHTKHFSGITPNTNCGTCHAGASAAAYNSPLHVDGFINVTGAYSQGKSHAPGNGYGTCSATACHDNGTGTKVVTPTWGTPAAGGTCTACHALQPATGSHSKHLLTHAAAVNCGSCHSGTVQGVSVNLANHLDGNIDVTVGGYPTSKIKGSAYATCSNVSCHNSPAGYSPAFTAPAVTWGTPLQCDSCHGFPPAGANHASGVITNPANCNSCHSEVSPGGTVSTATFATPALHMNGVVDGGNCDSCHGYPPVRSMTGNGTSASYSSARLQNYSGGGGVHDVAGHLPKNTKTSLGLGFSPCLNCHPQGLTHNEGFGSFSTQHVQVAVLPKYKFDKNRPIVYNAKQSGTGKTTGTCANVACHFQKSPPWSSEAYTQRH